MYTFPDQDWDGIRATKTILFKYTTVDITLISSTVHFPTWALLDWYQSLKFSILA